MTETASRGARNRDKVYATLALIIAAAAVYASVDIAFSGGISGTDYPVWADKMQIPVIATAASLPVLAAYFMRRAGN